MEYIPIFDRRWAEIKTYQNGKEQNYSRAELKLKEKEFKDFQKEGIHAIDVSQVTIGLRLARLTLGEGSLKYVMLVDASQRSTQLKNMITAINYLAVHGWKLITYSGVGNPKVMIAHAIMEHTPWTLSKHTTHTRNSALQLYIAKFFYHRRKSLLEKKKGDVIGSKQHMLERARRLSNDSLCD